MDKSISIAIMLFILSMISERFVTWVKLQFGKDGKSLFGFSKKGEDLTIKSNDEHQEKYREQMILGLNIVLSIFIAVVANANFFEILKAKAPYEAIGWKCFCPENFDPSALIGWPLTGLFISLGSKFWHDLLDLLLFTKDMKKKLAVPQTYEITSVDQLDEYLKFTEADLVKLAIAQNEQALRIKFPNIRDFNDSIAAINNERRMVMSVYFKDDQTKGFPEVVPAKLPSGKQYNVRTETIEDVGTVTITFGLDGALRHENLNFTGSACCLLSAEDDHFLLTNCHVLTDGLLQNPLENTGTPGVMYEEEPIGTWSFGAMNRKGDFAMVKLEDKERFVDTYHPKLFNNKFREVTKDECPNLRVHTTGSKTKNKSGYVVDVFINLLKVEYKGGNAITYIEALLIGDRQDRKLCKPITDGGDSGGLLYDEQGNLLGVITAKDKRFTYVIPIKRFLEISPYPSIQIL